ALSVRPITLTLPAPRPARRTIAGATRDDRKVCRPTAATRRPRTIRTPSGVFVNPNARTVARGRFTERGCTIKTAGVYRFAKEVTLGIAARYQDGQHFARWSSS
ncbi:MAG: hypothetical protein DMF92_13655, partial [Acidobacteria bacterium]